MQRGCVPIVYDIKSGIPEVVTDGNNGFIVRKSAWDQITDRIKRLQNDPLLWARMSAASTATVDRMGLTQDAMGRKYEKIVAEILSEIEDGRYIRPPAL
jgi:glycosyltransferase involved in cell wall biosynthesis